MIYGAYLKQEEGCDYTIGCGLKFIDLNASTFTEAQSELQEIIGEEYNHPEFRLDSAVIYEILGTVEFDIVNFYASLDRMQDQVKIAAERKEYERLKGKFGIKESK